MHLTPFVASFAASALISLAPSGASVVSISATDHAAVVEGRHVQSAKVKAMSPTFERPWPTALTAVDHTPMTTAAVLSLSNKIYYCH